MSNIEIRNKDCIQGLSELDSNSISLVITDPPYNASNSKMTWEEKAYSSLNEEWDKIEDLDGFNEKWIFEIERVLCEGGALYVYCSYHNLLSVWKALEKTGLRLRNLLTWYRPDNMPMKRAYLGYFAFSSLWILFFTKGKIKTWNYDKMKELNGGKQMRDIFIEKLNSSYKIYHPTQKPINQIRKLIQISTNEGDLILDPFIGGGTTPLACHQTNRRFIGFEINPEYCKIATERLNQEILCFPETLLSQSADAESLISVKRESADSPNSPQIDNTNKEEANFS